MAATTGGFWTYDEMIRDIETHFTGKNVMLVIDCCYAGSVEHALTAYGPLRCTYVVLASQQADQVARGQWTVTMALNSVLHGAEAADRNGDGAISVAEIVSYTTDAVAMVKQDRMAIRLFGSLDTSEQFLKCDINGNPVACEKGVWAPRYAWAGVRNSSDNNELAPASVMFRHRDRVWLRGGKWTGQESCTVQEDEGSKILFFCENDQQNHIEAKELVYKYAFRNEGELGPGQQAYVKWEGGPVDASDQPPFLLPNWYPCSVIAVDGTAAEGDEIADADFALSLLSSLPGVDMQDPQTAALLDDMPKSTANLSVEVVDAESSRRWRMDTLATDLLPSDYFTPNSEVEDILSTEHCLQALKQAGVTLESEFRPGTRVICGPMPRWRSDPQVPHPGVVFDLTGKMTASSLAQLCNSAQNQYMHDSRGPSYCVSWDDAHQYSIVGSHLLKDSTGFLPEQWRTVPAAPVHASGGAAAVTFKKGDTVWLKGGPWTGKPNGWRGEVQRDVGDKVIFLCEDGEVYRESKARVCNYNIK